MHPVAFGPRRLGHANLFVGDLERAVEFYSRVAGIELIRREPGIDAAFHSNGNTHHDVGLIQCSGGVRRGIDGFVQPSSYRGHSPGLNHFGWEVNSEADLIAAVARAEAAGVRIVNYANHQISHSVYVPDPDGNYHEFYADIVRDWRTIFNLEREDLVSEQWNWQQSAPGLGPMHPPADSRRVEQAIFHPRCISHAMLAAEKFDACVAFLTDIAGLSVLHRDDRAVALAGAEGKLDLVVVRAGPAVRRGLYGVSFIVDDPADLDASRGRAQRERVALVDNLVPANDRTLSVRDPDGLVVEFYSGRARSLLDSPAALAATATS